ncbi:HNH endonuclease family protein [Mycobacterium sp.]|uniref:HNH endonuclease family protein n=1 Tax=Mycobacterium sp. TaxID=1785 RepID=UPI0025D93707|nr:HNH endonuclease family protein [Mycobacterium sp.]
MSEVTGTATAAETTPAAIGPLLERVTVVDHIDPVPGYQRSCKKGQACVFGEAWHDPLSHSGCDVRNRLLAKSLHNVVFKPNTHDCKVIAGQLNPDPYTGTAVDLHQVAVDHIVPLHAAWNAGASHWDLQRRRAFANDMTELIAVSSTQNSRKSDSTLAEWLPPVSKCDYVIRYLTVTAKYQLPITVKDRAAAVAACAA